MSNEPSTPAASGSGTRTNFDEADHDFDLALELEDLEIGEEGPGDFRLGNTPDLATVRALLLSAWESRVEQQVAGRRQVELLACR